MAPRVIPLGEGGTHHKQNAAELDSLQFGVGAQRGLGAIILTTQVTLNTPVAFASLVWISVVGLLLYGVTDLITRRIAPWAEELRREIV